MKLKPFTLRGVWLVTIGMIALAGTSCRNRQQPGSAIQAFEENGIVWGWGNMRLGPASPTIAVSLDRLPVPGPNGQQFKLLVSDSETGAKTDLFYADWHPAAEPPVPVVFASQFFLQNRAGAPGVVDVYVKLKKAGRTWPKAMTLAVGTADTSARGRGRYPVALADGIKLSAVAVGEQSGAVVFHYADLPVGENLPWIEEAPLERLNIEGFNPQTITGKQAWTLPSGLRGKLTFVSAKVRALPVDQAKECQDKFYAVSRTAANKLNSACQLKIAPASVVPASGNWLTCSVFVQFVDPVKESQKTCRILATFIAEDSTLDQLSFTVLHSGDGQ